MRFSREVIQELLAGSARQRLALKEAYARLPETRCRRQTHCCSLLPEMSLVEAVSAIHMAMKPENRVRLSGRLLRYFFLNPVEILGCPLLEGRDCSIYPDRFFGCRAYGLWSEERYQQQTKLSRQARKATQAQWERLGISLPQGVVDFQLEYCTNVELRATASVDDTFLLEIFEMIEDISKQLAPWHDYFRQRYFSDLSFLLASVVLGFNEAIQLKFEVVRDFISSGRTGKIDEFVDKLNDLLENLTV